MSSSEQQQSPNTLHGRNVSHSRRQAVPRRSTRGPLDGDDPLTAASSNTPSPSRQSRPSERLSTPAVPTTPSRSPVPQPSIADRAKKDFSFLQRPDNFHSLADADVPPAFQDSPHRPAQTEPLDSLLANGHFRPAAAQAATQLTTTTEPTDHATIFHLLYIRLACLQLTGHHDLAAQESKILQDLNDPFYTDARTKAHLSPWELRVLAVRLQALGFGDWRRGIMGYYELAREARLDVRRKDADGASRAESKARLHDLGVRVANALLEMGDNETAARHIETLPAAVQTPGMRVALALVYVRLGDVDAARRCVADAAGSLAARVVEALCLMADGAYADAAERWQALLTAAGGEEGDAEFTEVIGQNLALCLLYVGDITRARTLFESTLSTTKPTRTLLFNLSTITELCADNADAQKRALSARVAEMPPSSTGWAFGAADFKM